MSWIDHWAIVAAILLALFANSAADAALRASVALYLRDISAERSPYYMSGPGWIRSYELRKIFGPFVYPALRHLHRRNVIERYEEKLSGHKLLRDGRASVLYRWKPTKDSVS